MMNGISILEVSPVTCVHFLFDPYLHFLNCYIPCVARFDVFRKGTHSSGWTIGDVIKFDFIGHPKRIQFHFAKTSHDKDEWIEFGSPRIAPLFTKVQMNNFMLTKQPGSGSSVSTKSDFIGTSSDGGPTQKTLPVDNLAADTTPDTADSKRMQKKEDVSTDDDPTSGSIARIASTVKFNKAMPSSTSTDVIKKIKRKKSCGTKKPPIATRDLAWTEENLTDGDEPTTSSNSMQYVKADEKSIAASNATICYSTENPLLLSANTFRQHEVAAYASERSRHSASTSFSDARNFTQTDDDMFVSSSSSSGSNVRAPQTHITSHHSASTAYPGRGSALEQLLLLAAVSSSQTPISSPAKTSRSNDSSNGQAATNHANNIMYNSPPCPTSISNPLGLNYCNPTRHIPAYVPSQLPSDSPNMPPTLQAWARLFPSQFNPNAYSPQQR
jgi:hypothetical protein